MGKRYEIRLAGSGGQGLVLGGVILAEAAILEGKNACQSQSYGPESRGGASKSEVILSDEEIDYPKATSIDLLLCMTEASADKYIKDAPDSCIVIADGDLVPGDIPSKYRHVKAPITRLARETVGREFVANIVALALIAELTKVVSVESLEKAVLARVPKGTEELNKKAIRVGQEAAREHGASLLAQ
ncbi:MAG: 2-oxoacid:acceptor oxidoreductase family protein [Acidobacteriota bacterium]